MLVKQLKTEEQQGRFLSMLLGTLGASFLGDLLTDKEALGMGPGQGTIRAGKGTFRSG